MNEAKEFESEWKACHSAHMRNEQSCTAGPSYVEGQESRMGLFLHSVGSVRTPILKFLILNIIVPNLGLSANLPIDLIFIVEDGFFCELCDVLH